MVTADITLDEAAGAGLPVLRTSRLVVRPLAHADRGRCRAVLAPRDEDAFARWFAWAVAAPAALADLRQPPYGERAIVHAASGELVGLTGLVPSHGPFAQLEGAPAGGTWEPEFGLYWALSPQHRGRGLRDGGCGRALRRAPDDAPREAADRDEQLLKPRLPGGHASPRHDAPHQPLLRAFLAPGRGHPRRHGHASTLTVGATTSALPIAAGRTELQFRLRSWRRAGGGWRSRPRAGVTHPRLCDRANVLTSRASPVATGPSFSATTACGVGPAASRDRVPAAAA
jgi:hypothetical protein